MAAPPPGLTAAQRRIWMDTDQNGGQVYSFCKNACKQADIIIYYGESGQDAGVEIGLACAYDKPIIGIRGPLESPGLMLHGSVSIWVEDAGHVIEIIQKLLGMIQNNPSYDKLVIEELLTTLKENT